MAGSLVFASGLGVLENGKRCRGRGGGGTARMFGIEKDFGCGKVLLIATWSANGMNRI